MHQNYSHKVHAEKILQKGWILFVGR